MKKLTVKAFLAAIACMACSAVVFAAEGGVSPDAAKWYAIASALAISVAAFGGALAQGRAVCSALEGISRNPEAAGKIFTPMIIGLALIETLVIYALVIAFLINGKF